MSSINESSYTQKLLSYDCPVLYGNSAFPLYILFSFFLVCLFYSITEMVFDCKSRSKKKLKSKTLFLISCATFFGVKCCLLCMPFPFDEQLENTFCYQLPRILLLITWEFMVIWLGPPTVISNKASKKSKYIIPVVFLVLDFFIAISNLLASFIFIV